MPNGVSPIILVNDTIQIFGGGLGFGDQKVKFLVGAGRRTF